LGQVAQHVRATRAERSARRVGARAGAVLAALAAAMLLAAVPAQAHNVGESYL